MYRWHMMAKIRFQRDRRVTIQALGWRSMQESLPRYLPSQDDIASMLFCYQTEPFAPFLKLPGLNDLEVT